MTTPRNRTDIDSADRPFDNIINFRDVGKTINGFMGRRVLKEGVLFRSARLDDASERDKRRLLDEFHISTVLDLRSVTEHRIATQKRRAERGLPTQEDQAPLTLDTKDHLVDIPGIHRVLISLTGKAWERSLIWRLDWVNFFKVLGLAASGYRTDAVKIVGEQVMAPRGLIGLGQDTIDFSTGEMREIFHLLAGRPHTNPNDNPDDNNTTNTNGNDDDDNNTNANDNSNGEDKDKPSYPLLLHCTQGKDRTGLVILLLLLLTRSVPDAAIARDYMRSEPELLVEAEERLKEVRALGIPDEYLKCPEGFPGAIREYLDEKYGGVEGYLKFAGIGKEEREEIRSKLLV